MFADNGKISAHQIRCLLFADWAAKLLLLLPLAGGTLGGWDFLLAAALGGVWALLYLLVLSKLLPSVKGSFTACVRERLGKIPALLTGILALLYLLVNVCFLARLTGRICRVYLLPETSETLLAVLALAVGAASASGGSEKRARAAELLFFPLAAALTLMVLASFGNVRLEHFRAEGTLDIRQILRRSGTMFAAFSGAALFLYERPRTNCKDKTMKRALILGLLVTLLFLLLTFAAALGVLGEASILRLPFPVLALMNSASLPGGFLQRWDAVFLAFLLFGLLFAAATSCYYMRQIAGELAAGRHMQHSRTADGGTADDDTTDSGTASGDTAGGRRLAALYLPVFAAVLLVRDYETAAALYLRWALCCLAPLMAAIPVFLLVIEQCRQKRAA